MAYSLWAAVSSPHNKLRHVLVMHCAQFVTQLFYFCPPSGPQPNKEAQQRRATDPAQARGCSAAGGDMAVRGDHNFYAFSWIQFVSKFDFESE